MTRNINLLETPGETGPQYAERIRAIQATRIKIQRMRYAGTIKNLGGESTTESNTDRCSSGLHRFPMITNYTEYNSLGRK